MKTCTVCLKTKQQDQFYHNTTSADGYFNMCKSCCLKYQRYRKEKAKETKPRRPRQKIFYSPTKPLPPDPEHQIKIENGPITLTFE